MGSDEEDGEVLDTGLFSHKQKSFSTCEAFLVRMELWMLQPEKPPLLIWTCMEGGGVRMGFQLTPEKTILFQFCGNFKHRYYVYDGWHSATMVRTLNSPTLLVFHSSWNHT